MSAPYVIRRIETQTADLARLIQLSETYMGALYPAESNHFEDVQALLGPKGWMLGVWLDDRLIACGAVKIMDDDGHYGEVKRVFVLDEHRGKGVSKAIMQALEDHLRAKGVMLARLETGIKQPEAIGLYRRLGYRERGPFGGYRADPLSLFMEKPLG
jgi:putative acetyltransferase